MCKEAVKLTGMTFRECLNQLYRRETEELEFTDEPPVYTDPEDIELSRKTGQMNASQRRFMFFLKEYSSDPQKSFRLIKAYSFSSFLGLAALLLAQYTAHSQDPDKLKIALAGNIILLILNLGLLFAGRIYRERHPLDEITAEKLREKRSIEKENREVRRTVKIIACSIVAAAFIGLMIFLNLGMASMPAPQKSQTPKLAENVWKISRSDVHTALTERNFETANIPTTYWYIDESKLMYVCAGVKDGMKFEYYEYSDGETTDLVYNSITYSVSADMELSEREQYERTLPDGNKIFTLLIDGVYQLCIFKDNTVVYAYSEKGLDEINSVLYELGYLHK